MIRSLDAKRKAPPSDRRGECHWGDRTETNCRNELSGRREPWSGRRRRPTSSCAWVRPFTCVRSVPRNEVMLVRRAGQVGAVQLGAGQIGAVQNRCRGSWRRVKLAKDMHIKVALAPSKLAPCRSCALTQVLVRSAPSSWQPGSPRCRPGSAPPPWDRPCPPRRPGRRQAQNRAPETDRTEANISAWPSRLGTCALARRKRRASAGLNHRGTANCGISPEIRCVFFASQAEVSPVRSNLGSLTRVAAEPIASFRPRRDVANRIDAFDVALEIGADRIREDQRVINVLRHILVNQHPAAVAEFHRQICAHFRHSDGFEDDGLDMRHGQITSPLSICSRADAGIPSGAAAGRAAGVALHAGAVAHQGEVAAGAATVALKALHPGFRDPPGMGVLGRLPGRSAPPPARRPARPPDWSRCCGLDAGADLATDRPSPSSSSRLSSRSWKCSSSSASMLGRGAALDQGDLLEMAAQIAGGGHLGDRHFRAAAVACRRRDPRRRAGTTWARSVRPR